MTQLSTTFENEQGKELERCKLCGGKTVFKFALPLVHGLEGRYVECAECQMLQSSHLDALTPDRLQEFYQNTDPSLDSGAAWRQACVAQRLDWLAKWRLFYARRPPGFKLLDFGCGSGFVVNYLASRRRWLAFGYDPYSTPCYSADRVLRDWSQVVREGPYDVVVASEVFEHFLTPDKQIAALREILKPEGSYLFITTGLYIPGKRTASWPYLGPQSGQHVAFFSQRAIQQAEQLIGATEVFNLGAEYEWLYVVGQRPLAPLKRLQWVTMTTLLRRAVRLGLAPLIE